MCRLDVYTKDELINLLISKDVNTQPKLYQDIVNELINRMFSFTKRELILLYNLKTIIVKNYHPDVSNNESIYLEYMDLLNKIKELI